MGPLYQLQWAMKSPKERAREALENHHKKLANKKRRFTKNRKPEKEVAKFALEWMREKNWDVQIVEAKAAYKPSAGRYIRNSSVSAGTCDCIGTLPNGVFVAIEFKAPGRLSTFASDKNHEQRDYLLAKIHSGAFACVVDSVARLENIYNEYVMALEVSRDKAKNFLLASLPKKDND